MYLIESGELDLPMPGADQMWVRVHPDGDVSGLTEAGGAHWRLVEWRPGEPRDGLWDMGHLPEHKYADLRNDYLRGDISQEDFLAKFHDPENYSVQDPYRNRSHIDER